MIRIISVGKVKDKNISALVSEFSKRLGKYTKFEIVSVKDSISDDDLIDKFKGFIIVLGEEGTPVDSVQFSKDLKKMMLAHPTITFVIGDPDGLSDRVKEKANWLFSLSKMTFLHEFALLFLVEQIYRAFTIMKNEKYHR